VRAYEAEFDTLMVLNENRKKGEKKVKEVPLGERRITLRGSTRFFKRLHQIL
jgi:hypothetical protein